VTALAEELQQFEFLHEPYRPGTDSVGDLWEAAREQRDRSGLWKINKATD
jgi:hypothetical protein